MILKQLNNSITSAKHGVPLKDLTTDSTMFFAMSRRKYIQTRDNKITNDSRITILQQKKWNNNNDNSHIARSNYFQRRVDFPNNEFNSEGKPMSNTNNYERNYVERSIKRVRAGGARVPLKVTHKNF
jgi:hypothetical protein|tara:strand:- start:327 stop:707 length:381 start_codon:yes stop_codon:yes gene_type:complete